MLKNRGKLSSLVGMIILTASVISPARAEDDVTRIQAVSPAAQLLVSQASMCLLGRKYDEAAAALSKAIQLAPKSALLYKYRADAYVGAQKWQLATADFDTAISLDPSYLDAYAGRGGLEFSQKQYQSAIPDLAKNADFEKNGGGSNDMTKLNLLDCYLEQKQYAKVVELSSLGIKHMPWAAYHVTRAKAYLELGENRKAIEDCDAARKLDSGMFGIGPIRNEALKRLGLPTR